ncbi:MAG: hypothetical protein FWG78_03330 [Coriobacteriia bacterium]|nr:hypothetical protein [Coriobacteriia bacterium]
MPTMNQAIDTRNQAAVLKEETVDNASKRAWAEARLMAELEKGRRSGEEHGWFTLDEIEEELGLKGLTHA